MARMEGVPDGCCGRWRKKATDNKSVFGGGERLRGASVTSFSLVVRRLGNVGAAVVEARQRLNGASAAAEPMGGR